ncbi:hypothetical protein CRV24_008003 [Beauveria bassiana]|nr:hypothetical protein CRV24_008003 [Beauveria bassiana]
MEVRLIIVSGRAGSGKSSTANEMSEQLKRLEMRHAHIDCDNLDAMFPADDGADMLLANLAALWSNYYHLRGVDRLIISGTAAVPDALAERRLKQREVGSELSQLLASSRRMAGVLESQVGGWARRVPTDQREVKEVALEILRTAGWI